MESEALNSPWCRQWTSIVYCPIPLFSKFHPQAFDHLCFRAMRQQFLKVCQGMNQASGEPEAEVGLQRPGMRHQVIQVGVGQWRVLTWMTSRVSQLGTSQWDPPPFLSRPYDTSVLCKWRSTDNRSIHAPKRKCCVGSIEEEQYTPAPCHLRIVCMQPEAEEMHFRGRPLMTKATLLLQLLENHWCQGTKSVNWVVIVKSEPGIRGLGILGGHISHQLTVVFNHQIQLL